MEQCSPDKDFLRHIVNRVLADYAEKVPSNVIDDIRKHIGRAEDRYRFTIFGGDPRKLAEYLDSEEWSDLMEYLKNLHMEWILKAVLEKLAEEYRQSCPQIASKAIDSISKMESRGEERKLDRDTVYRSLKYAGYRVEIAKDGSIEVTETNIKVRIEVSNGKIHYTICKDGTATTLDAILTRIEKLREL
ncbi:MAG: hypothetical protein F7B18_01480 [Desulfurococcales archaeon]|nr:hypothetical protein [Desulfurococcales archaeon]